MNRVCAERKNLGLTQAELAKEVDVDQSTVVRWEAGGSIPQEKMVKMLSLFGCDLDWLLGVSDDRKTVS